ncbi:MAG: TonB-dependent receptor [Bacteroidetes bacterium]|nr:TonB-dependent receptor [Bacteroidota bacterium]
MKFKIIVFVFLLFSYANNVTAHNLIRGNVSEAGEKKLPVAGAGIYFPGLNAGTVTDSAGNFVIDVHANLPFKMVVSMIGFKPDTLLITDISFKTISLSKNKELKEVEISAKREDLMISTMQPINTQKITEGELLKAACCNLSEAFETNPTINVAYKDAVTGAKEIQLLGLSGIYSQLLTENIPNMQSIAGIYGLTFIPGPWMESIQLTKGSGSVLNGYESTTGLINVEFKKPLEKSTPKFYLNLFSDEKAAMEINTFYKKKVSSKVSTMLLAHGRYMNTADDMNDDGFMDMPKGKQINLYNRWQLQVGRRVEMQVGVKFLADYLNGGQLDAPESHVHVVNPGQLYLTKVDTKRGEAYAKLGIVYPKRPLMSIGNIAQFVYHDMNSNFGLKTYDATNRSFFYQGIFQNYFVKEKHQYKVGFTYKMNEVNQVYLGDNFEIIENIPGVFFEYTYSTLNKFTMILGAREDYHFEDDWVLTPRIHLKYNFTDNSVLRLSAGSSYRRPYFIADHISILATSRTIVLNDKTKAERAWNYGLNFTQKFVMNEKDYSFSFDAYRTDFSQQLVMDVYSDSTQISFYNLDGESYSNSLQGAFTAELIENLELRLAYKFDDVRSTYRGVLREVPLVTRSRGLMNLSYELKQRHWKFNYTLVYEGQKALQFVYLPENGNRDTRSPDFFTMNFQATKEFKRFEIYGGAENLLDFRQKVPIINSTDPFGDKFDATNIWGPIAGRRVYLGLRFSIR